MDRLSQLLERFSLSAGVFYTGNICGVHDFEHDARRGHVHLVKRGPVQLIGGPEGGLSITEPSLLFMPRADAHKLIADDRHGADVVCAAIQFGAGGSNPITDSLPSLVVIPLRELPGAQPLLELLYEEAFSLYCGRQAALDRLCEILLIRLLRHCLDRGLVKGGALSGLSDPRLAKALTALHANPAKEWELTEMANLAGMSRARFAVRFREITGETPANYLATWRINLAQSLLRSGRPLKHVSVEVGYGSPSALTRAFVRKMGISPTGWLKTVETGAAVA
ncbi:MAG: AraC family transcriptional regulator [Burkholderiales bacterium]|nr:AraC family transcriptional regulator [Burkholderiales bacterium]